MFYTFPVSYLFIGKFLTVFCSPPQRLKYRKQMKIAFKGFITYIQRKLKHMKESSEKYAIFHTI